MRLSHCLNADDNALGKDPEKLSTDLEVAIRQVCYLKEKAIISAMSAYHSRQETINLNYRT